MDAVENKFMKLLNTSKSNIRQIIPALQYNKGSILYDYAKQLPTITFVEDGQRLLVRGAIKNTLQLPKNKDKSGSGIIYRNGNNQIYKKIIIDLDESFPIVDFFLESFIAIVLSTNVNVGKYICVPIGIYKNKAIRRNARASTLASSASSLAAAGAPAVPLEAALFITMEVIPYNIEEYIRIHTNTSIEQLVLPIISQVANILNYLEEFKFCHNDLHSENIMLDEGGNVKLIDFGRSSIFFEGNSYGNNIDNLISVNPVTKTKYRPTPCDMAIFLIELSTKMRNTDLQDFIRSLFLIEGVNLFDYTTGLLKSNIGKGTALRHHYLYYPWAVYTDFGDNFTTYNPTWDDTHRDLFTRAYTTGNLKPSNVILRVNERLALLSPMQERKPRSWCGTKWCNWKPWGGTRKRTGKKHNKKGKTKRKQ